MICHIAVRRVLALACTLLIAALPLLPFGGGSTLAAGRGSVFVNVHVCPTISSLKSASFATLAHLCQGDGLSLGDGNGFAFTLVTEGIFFPQTTGQLTPHAVIWDDVPAHIFTIQETIPLRFGTPIVFCQGDHGSTDFARMPIFGGTQIRPTLAAGGQLSCDWFNVRLGPLMTLRRA